MLATEVLKQIAGGKATDWEKVAKLVSTDEELDWSNVKGVVAAFEFIFKNAGQHETPSETLILELQQLGMPKEHCDRLVGPYSEYLPYLYDSLFKDRLVLPRLLNADWQVDYILSSKNVFDLNSPSVQLQLSLSSSSSASPTHFSFDMTEAKLRALISELTTARMLMDTVNQD